MRTATRVVTTLVVFALVFAVYTPHTSADGDIERRIADFWKRVDALRPIDDLAAGDLGQWATNLIERDPSARISVAEFRRSTASMQAAIDRAGRIATPAARDSDVERRIAEFWSRVDSLRPSDALAASDLGQWALNVTQRDPGARILVADFRAATAVMQRAIDIASPFTFSFGAGVSSDEQEWIRSGAEGMRAYFIDTFGSDPVKAVVVDVFARDTTGVASAGPGRISIDVKGIAWQPPRPTPPEIDHRKTAAHEYVHIWQHQIGCVAGMPTWITEGVAEYLAYESLIGAGSIRRAAVDAVQARLMIQARGRLPLRTLEQQFPPDLGYQMGYTAVARLAARSGVAAIRQHCLERAVGTDWRVAFEKVFGVTVDAFYAEYDAWNGYPPQ